MHRLASAAAGLALCLAFAACTDPSFEEPTINATVIPLPTSVEPDGAAFVLDAAVVVVTDRADDEVAAIGDQLAEVLGTVRATATGRATGDASTSATASEPGSEPGSEPASERVIVLALDGAADLGDEGYELSATPQRVEIRAFRPAGLFRATQTMRQLAVDGEVPGGRIRDVPRFAWRGVMLDVARHFFGVDDVLRFIDLAALYKINVLHLHLTDDQGWRIAVAARPELTGIGAATEVGGGAGGHYTAEDYARIVAYAARRYVTVVPEIDLPGHTNAALTAYPELACDGSPPEPYTGVDVGFSSLCAGKPETYGFVDDVVRELAASTPGGYLHVGGDEALSTSADDYATFMGKVLPIVAEHGKEAIGWQEIARTPVPPGTLVQYWDTREPGHATAAAAAGARLIFSPADHVYLDMKYHPDFELGQDWAGHVDVRDAYDWDPATLVSGVGEDDVVGVEAALWTETVTTMDEVEVMTFPRLPAVAEVGWSGSGQREWDDFRVRLGAQALLWESLGVDFYRSSQVDWKTP